jgi:hypothetical protein
MYWITGLGGFFLMVAPYLFGYADNPAAMWTSVGSGFVVLVVSIWEGMESKKANWEYWVAGIAGLFAVVAPFIFGFGSVSSAMWTTVIAGAVIAILAGSKIWVGGSSTQET